MSDNPTVPADRSQGRRGRVTVTRYATAADADRDDVAFWRELPEADRVLHAWRLSLEIWRLRGEPPHEPGLRRPVARLRRR